jgi:ABC-type lipoprotein export system ATPase subunit
MILFLLGPSGSGKSTLLNIRIAKIKKLHPVAVISCSTREMKVGLERKIRESRKKILVLFSKIST